MSRLPTAETTAKLVKSQAAYQARRRAARAAADAVMRPIMEAAKKRVVDLLHQARDAERRSDVESALFEVAIAAVEGA